MEGLQFILPLDALGPGGPQGFRQLLDFVFLRLRS